MRSTGKSNRKLRPEEEETETEIGTLNEIGC